MFIHGLSDDGETITLRRFSGGVEVFAPSSEEGTIIKGRKAFTFGIQASYQNAWQIDLSYTTYMGAGRWNLINDRDFIGGFIKYSF